ncbi:hypothetical protein DK843_03005 [Chromobacterium phragmitis]|uniref:Diguanylate cyclase n=1 Tax=Chromobacterium phragmitis TaxID=2202141 RepID=A0A344UDM2_9NEIS|nr:hypothetical protein DK843_03005 [Chromobacterium phragmitis]
MKSMERRSTSGAPDSWLLMGLSSVDRDARLARRGSGMPEQSIPLASELAKRHLETMPPHSPDICPTIPFSDIQQGLQDRTVPPSVARSLDRLLRRRHALLIGAAGIFLALLGGFAAAGWLLRIEIGPPESIHMVLSTAVCLSLYGAALLLAPWPRLMRLAAAPLPLIASLALLEAATGQRWIDFPSLHAWRHDAPPLPGRMVPTTALALLFLAAGIWLLNPADRRRRRALRICTLAPLLLGALGATAYLINLELLYGWGSSVRMPLLTSAGLIVAALGLDGLSRRGRLRHPRSQDMVRAVSSTAAALLVALSLATGLLVYRISSDAHQRSLLTVMSYSVRQRAALLQAQFKLADSDARRLFQRRDVQSLLESASQGKLDASAAAAALAGFNRTSVTGLAILDAARRPLAQAGYFETRPRQSAPMLSPPNAQLLWNGHYLYRTEQVYRTSAGTARLRLEQRLDMFDRIVQDTAPHDALSGIFSLCGRDERYLRCFSQTPADKGSTIPIAGNIHRFTVWPAFSGKSGTMHTVDFSRRNVIGAYEPVTGTGLAFSYKIKVGDLLAPIRQELETSALIMLAMVALGAAVLRTRTGPVLKEVLRSNQMAELAAERFRTAAEANMDAFVIMEALRDADGKVEDFRVVYLNAEAERMWGLRRADSIGQKWLTLAETHAIPNHFDSYKRVMDSGQPLSEEVPRAFDAVHPIWIHHEIVHAGDGISISVRDITQKKLAELDLVLREALLKTVTDSIPALVSFVDADQRYRYCNKTYMRLFGIPPEQVIGRSMRDFLGEESYQAVSPYIEQALQGQTVSFEKEMFLHGSLRYVEGRYIPQQHANGTVSGFYVMVWDITQARAREIQLRSQVSLDAMTGLLNRAAFMDMLDDEIKHHYLKRQSLALLFLDIDRFKQVNDTLGHAAGDELIKAFAQRLRQNVRGTDHVARLGGDEFVVLLVGLDAEQTAIAVVEKLMAALRRDIDLSGQTHHVSASIGVAYAYMPDITPARLLEIADQGLYQAKAAGRDTYRLLKVG